MYMTCQMLGSKELPMHRVTWKRKLLLVGGELLPAGRISTLEEVEQSSHSWRYDGFTLRFVLESQGLNGK